MKHFTEVEFEAIINKHSRTLFIIAYNYTRDSFISEDIVQDAFFKLYRAHKKFESVEHIKYWLIRVTINLSLNMKKQREKELLIDDEYINNISDTADIDSKNESIYKSINELKESYKTIILLYYYDDYSLKEIASILKISETNAQTRLDRAREKLKQILLERKKNE